MKSHDKFVIGEIIRIAELLLKEDRADLYNLGIALYDLIEEDNGS